MVQQLRAHHAGLAGDDEPRALGRHARGGAVADHVHLRVVAADLHTRSRGDPELIAKAALAAAELAAAAGLPYGELLEKLMSLGISYRAHWEQD